MSLDLKYSIIKRVNCIKCEYRSAGQSAWWARTINELCVIVHKLHVTFLYVRGFFTSKVNELSSIFFLAYLRGGVLAQLVPCYKITQI